MNLDELKEAWRSQDTRTTVRTILLLDSIRENQKRNMRSIWLRNIREGWGSILAAVFFICSVESDVESRLQLWPFYSAMAILFGIGVFRVIDNRRQKRRLRYENSSLSFVECSLLNINHRIWLLDHIFWWWILPAVVAGVLVIAQIIMLVGLQEPTLLLWKLGPAVGIGCVILAVVYWGNRWTARNYWLPRKTELEAVAAALKTS